MASARRLNNAPSVHRLRLTHGKQAIPKLTRESTEQFLESTGTDSPTTAIHYIGKRKPYSKPINKTFRSRNRLQVEHSEKPIKKRHEIRERIKLTTSRSKSTPGLSMNIILPPIRNVTENRDLLFTSEQSMVSYVDEYSEPQLTPMWTEEIVLPPLESTSSTSFYSSPLLIPSSSPIKEELEIQSEDKEEKKSDREREQDRFRYAYERALEIAHARRMKYDPFYLLGPTATPRMLYSYFDHTPMCVFSRGSACGHYQKKNLDYDRRSSSEIARRKIFDEIVIEKLT